jgi:hypothetical protein
LHILDAVRIICELVGSAHLDNSRAYRIGVSAPQVKLQAVAFRATLNRLSARTRDRIDVLAITAGQADLAIRIARIGVRSAAIDYFA